MNKWLIKIINFPLSVRFSGNKLVYFKGPGFPWGFAYTALTSYAKVYYLIPFNYLVRFWRFLRRQLAQPQKKA